MTKNDDDGGRFGERLKLLENIDRPLEVEPEKMVYDGKTAEMMSVGEAKRLAKKRVERRSRLEAPVKPPDPDVSPEDAGQVTDPKTGEEVSVVEGQRRAAARLSKNGETDPGVIETDLRKKVVTATGEGIGEVFEVNWGCAEVLVYWPEFDAEQVPSRAVSRGEYFGPYGLLHVPPAAIKEITDEYIQLKKPENETNSN